MRSRFCDVDLCPKMQEAVGHFVLWKREEGTFFIHIEVVVGTPLGAAHVNFVQTEKKLVQIHYCPFCGTQLLDIGETQVRADVARERKRKQREAARS